MAFQKQNVGIVGCGASGLATLKELLAEGHTGTVFERSNVVGGIFTTVYQQGHMVSSTIITMFSDFLGSEGERSLTHPRMLSFVEYSRYLDEYAEHFGLKKHIRFEHNVTVVERTDLSSVANTKWRIRAVDARTNKEVEQEFDRVVICSGTHQFRAMPNFVDGAKFQGVIKHMQDVKKFEEFAGKRVCVVGSGEAAADMTLASAKHGVRSFISIRQTHGFIVPRYAFNGSNPADLTTCRVRYSIPLALAYIQVFFRLMFLKVQQFIRGGDDPASKTARQVVAMNWKQLRTSNFRNSYGTKNSGIAEAIANYGCEVKPGIAKLREHSVVFTDGSEEPIDEIVCCTGFENRFRFLEANTKDELIQRVTRDAAVSHNLYKHMIHPETGTALVFIGFVRPCFGAIPPLAEMQARWYALLTSNKVRLPDDKTLAARAKTYVRYIENMLTPYRTNRITNLTDFISFSDDMARQIGCRPSFGLRMFLTEPRLWIRCMIGPVCNAQYRLVGPHKKPDDARRTILTLKWTPGLLSYVEMALLYLGAALWFCGLRKFKPLCWYPIDDWEK